MTKSKLNYNIILTPCLPPRGFQSLSAYRIRVGKEKECLCISKAEDGMGRRSERAWGVEIGLGNAGGILGQKDWILPRPLSPAEKGMKAGLFLKD